MDATTAPTSEMDAVALQKLATRPLRFLHNFRTTKDLSTNVLCPAVPAALTEDYDKITLQLSVTQLQVRQSAAKYMQPQLHNLRREYGAFIRWRC